MSTLSGELFAVDSDNGIVTIDPKLFESFKRWSGHVPANYWANFLGVLTRVEFWAFTQEVRELWSRPRSETPGYPLSDEQVLDYAPLLEAVLDAESSFVMAALGAGWGRWLSIGAFAARQTMRTWQLVGVEAEPQHFQWMETHMEENAIPPSTYRLINAAVAGKPGGCWFYVGKPASWYGQSIVSEKSIREQPELGAEVSYRGERVRRIRCIDMDEVLGDLTRVDYMHMDIQGAEYDFLLARPDQLQARVKTVNVGTHSKKIERNLRKMFGGLGWRCKVDLPMNSKVDVYYGAEKVTDVQFGDGVQIWTNPRHAR